MKSRSSTGSLHELLRRIVVNEMLGNPDMHLKNIGVWYPDGRTPALPPAYDIVAYAAYNRRIGHALHLLPAEKVKLKMPVAQALQGKAAKPSISTNVIRRFCAELRIVEKPAATAIRKTVADAVEHWPPMIEASLLTAAQKRRLLGHFHAHPLVESLLRRQRPPGASPR